MSAEAGWEFVDTNILVYALDQTAGEKNTRAQALVRALWETRRGCVSVQVLQELYVTLTRKVSNPLSVESARGAVHSLADWRVHAPDAGDVLAAIEIHARYQLSFWDAMIVQSARRLTCDVLWSEDFSAGGEYRGVQVKNPFDQGGQP